jgi:UPF0755 protein
VRSLFKLFLAALLFAIGASLGASYWAYKAFNAPGTYTDTTRFEVASGQTGDAIIQNLARYGVVEYPQILRLAVRLLQPLQHPIHAGEYDLPPHLSMEAVWAYLQAGQMVQYKITIPEGRTVRQVLQLLADNKWLTGDVANVPLEGSLWPETYVFQKGQTRQNLIEQMQQAQQTWLAQHWPQRAKGLAVKTPQEALVLASIVEKETGVPHERPTIAGVFYNRLKAGMALQSDPTVVYVITKGLGDMQGKRLLHKHLKINSPINTYLHKGLPPQPIANVGAAALQAVLHPEKNNYYYFVADGTGGIRGGHVFSKTLSQHNKNVGAWRQSHTRQQQVKNHD